MRTLDSPSQSDCSLLRRGCSWPGSIDDFRGAKSWFVCRGPCAPLLWSDRRFFLGTDGGERQKCFLQGLWSRRFAPLRWSDRCLFLFGRRTAASDTRDVEGTFVVLNFWAAHGRTTPTTHEDENRTQSEHHKKRAQPRDNGTEEEQNRKKKCLRFNLFLWLFVWFC